MNPVQALRTDLLAAGTLHDDADEICDLYGSAIEKRGDDRWRRFYVRLFQALRSLSGRNVAGDAGAIRNLLLIVEDDFGHALFGPVALARLRLEDEAAVGAKGA